MRRWNGWSNEVMVVRLQDLPRALDARPCALLCRSGPDRCMRATGLVQP
ncbi:hypothetical protein IFU01_05460 [Oxalobacteraceae sp. CFBP 8763]|nr:hypothetical protein [Oxalobacteraceae sp. CFBP 8763]